MKHRRSWSFAASVSSREASRRSTIAPPSSSRTRRGHAWKAKATKPIGVSSSKAATSRGTTWCAGVSTWTPHRFRTPCSCARTAPISTLCRASWTTSTSASPMSFAARITSPILRRKFSSSRRSAPRPPAFGHHNLLVSAEGQALSKRERTLSIELLREEGLRGARGRHLPGDHRHFGCRRAARKF